MSVARSARSRLEREAEGAWPIVTPTFILMPDNPAADKVEASRNTLKFFDWAFRNAGEATTGLGFIPLPLSDETVEIVISFGCLLGELAAGSVSQVVSLCKRHLLLLLDGS